MNSNEGRRTPLRRRARITARAAAVTGLALVPLLASGPARADTAPTLGGWNVSADGNVVDILFDNTTGLAGAHPFTEADFPEAQSQFQTGPFGSGLATVFWPGSAGANFGSLSGELGIPTQLQPVVGQLNDPVRASAMYPAGPATAQYPPGGSNNAAEMQAAASDSGTSATAALADSGTQAVLSFGGAKGTSSAVANSTATATATSTLSDLSLLGGLIDIGSITSTATATSDGNTGSGSTTTHVTGVTVLGQPASIGTDGLVLPSTFTSVLGPLTGPLVTSVLQQTISTLALKVTNLPSSSAPNGAADTETSGGVQISISPPPGSVTPLEQLAGLLAPVFPAQAAIIPTLPGLLDGSSLTITLGRSVASASASPPFDDSFNAGAAPTAADTSGTGSDTSTDSSTGSSTSGTGAAAVVGTGSGAVDTGSTGSTDSGVAPAIGTLASTGGSSTPGSTATTPTTSGASLPAALISLSQPLGAGAVVLALLAAAALGYGLWRVARLLLPTDAGPVCPLGEENE